MHLNALPDATRLLLDRATREPLLAPFVLIGGTGLALQDAHRISEDLDFVVLDERLDRRLIRDIVNRLSPTGNPMLVTSARARAEFDNEGFDIDDTQQDWLIDGVKVTFFTPHEKDELAIHESTPRHDLGHVQVMDAEGIFHLKSMVLLNRTTSRDTFDLWHFVENRGKTIADVAKAMGDRARHFNLDAKLAKIAPPTFRADDPGFAAILPNAPRDTDELIRRMAGLVHDHRRHVAAEAARLTRGPHSSSPDYGRPDRENDRGR